MSPMTTMHIKTNTIEDNHKKKVAQIEKSQVQSSNGIKPIPNKRDTKRDRKNSTNDLLLH